MIGLYSIGILCPGVDLWRLLLMMIVNQLTRSANGYNKMTRDTTAYLVEVEKFLQSLG